MTGLSTHTGTELAHRSSGGMDVTLGWLHCDAEGKVGVCERSEGAYFEIPAESYLALGVHSNPFAHWDFGTVDDHDGRLAA